MTKPRTTKTRKEPQWLRGYTTHLAATVGGVTTERFESERQKRRRLKRIEEKQNTKAND